MRQRDRSEEPQLQETSTSNPGCFLITMVPYFEPPLPEGRGSVK